MHALMPLIEQVIVNRLVSRKAPLMGKSKCGLALIAISFLLFFVAAGFLIASGYSLLLEYYTTPAATLISAGMLLAVAMLTTLWGYMALKQQPAPVQIKDEDISKLLSLLGEALEEEWATPIRENPKTALLLAGIGGFVAGDHLQ